MEKGKILEEKLGEAVQRGVKARKPKTYGVSVKEDYTPREFLSARYTVKLHRTGPTGGVLMSQSDLLPNEAVRLVEDFVRNFNVPSTNVKFPKN